MAMIDIVSFYRFTDVEQPHALKQALEAQCNRLELLGTVLVAAEGINGTLAGAADHLHELLDWVAGQLDLDEPLAGRWSRARSAPFGRTRIRIKRELVALGRPDIRPQDGTGRHVGHAEWNTLLEDPETLVVDTRNHYEIDVGRFPGAVSPETETFREFQTFAEELATQCAEPGGDGIDRPVAMYCTGGIRCEKAAALLQGLGFRNVNQLDGGILNYLESVRAGDNRWQGECFVFDSRVAVDRDLSEGAYVQCHACRRPLTAVELASPDYREGVSCPRCVDELKPARRERLEERRKQVRLARQRGDRHILSGGSGDRDNR